MNTWTAMDSMKAKLSGVAGVCTCKIGIEAGLSPDDYPIIRLVPARFSMPDRQTVLIHLTVYYGMPLTEGDDGLESLYLALLEMETAIKAAIHAGDGYYAKFIDTITDEDRLEQYKLFASRFEISVPLNVH
jgi:hypothetical protein